MADTDGAFPNPRIIKDTGDTPPAFDIDITIPGSYTTEPASCVFDPDGCGSIINFAKIDGDPAVGGRDNDFTSATLIANPVPEPATLFLLGSGIGGLLYRRRRR